MPEAMADRVRVRMMTGEERRGMMDDEERKEGRREGATELTPASGQTFSRFSLSIPPFRSSIIPASLSIVPFLLLAVCCFLRKLEQQIAIDIIVTTSGG
jgi:hypothetical protein